MLYSLIFRHILSFSFIIKPTRHGTGNNCYTDIPWQNTSQDPIQTTSADPESKGENIMARRKNSNEAIELKGAYKLEDSSEDKELTALNIKIESNNINLSYIYIFHINSVLKYKHQIGRASCRERV